MRREHKIQSGILPAGYRQLEYIESTGVQSINTGFYPDNNSFCEVDILFTASGASDGCGVRWTQAPTYDTWSVTKGVRDTLLVYAGYNGQTRSTRYYNQPFTWTNRHLIRLEPLAIKVDDVIVATFTAATYSSPIPCLVQGKWILRKLQLGNSDSLARNYIPALQLEGNKPGLYDLCGSICPLTGTPFYINNNSGTDDYLYT